MRAKTCSRDQFGWLRPTEANFEAWERTRDIAPLTDFDYNYSRAELEELAAILEQLASRHDKVWCMFNNFERFAHGRTLREMMAH